MSRSSARISTTELQNCVVIRIEGEIDETFDGSLISGRRGVVVFDMGGVRRITSHGVLQWITALRSLDASYYCFINCRPSTMDQFNLVQAFPQRGELISFYATFVCTDCGHETEQLIDLRQHFEIHESLSLPEVSCPKCGGQTEFDEVPDLYFKYVLSAPTPRPPPAASAAIGGDQPTAPSRRRFEMKKEVEGTITAFWLSGHLDQRAYFKRAADGIEGTALIEIGELDGISDDAFDGFRKFLRVLEERAVVARVPATMVEKLAEVMTGWGRAKTAVVSFLVPLRCTGCQTIYATDVAGDQLDAVVSSGVTTTRCPRCMHPLEVQWPAELAEFTARLPVSTPPPSVQAYLRSHPPRGRVVGGDRMASAVDADRLLLGKYQVLDPIGQGGMGEVFLARQVGPEAFEKLVVLKRIRRDRIGDPQARDLFLKEARVAARLTHRNIVQIFDLERMDDEYIISMEYVNGIDLARALQLSRDLRITWPIEICCRVMTELCAALHAAHTYVDEDGKPKPVIHRDVSPSNILLSTEGGVKLADFGIARAAGEDKDEAAQRGKAGYAAPEQMAGSSTPVDERTDIYAAGVVLYECVTLRPISYGPTMPPTGPVPPSWRPHSLPQIFVARSGAPPLLQDVFERAVQHDPAHRYRTARELGRDLERIGRLVSETTNDDLALWIRRLVALRLESEGQITSPILTMNTGPNSNSGVFALEPSFTNKK